MEKSPIIESAIDMVKGKSKSKAKAKKKTSSKKAVQKEMILSAEYPFALIKQPVKSIEEAVSICLEWKERYQGYVHKFKLVEIDKETVVTMTDKLSEALKNP
jgi:hypothetical protein